MRSREPASESGVSIQRFARIPSRQRELHEARAWLTYARALTRKALRREGHEVEIYELGVFVTSCLLCEAVSLQAIRHEHSAIREDPIETAGVARGGRRDRGSRHDVRWRGRH